MSQLNAPARERSAPSTHAMITRRYQLRHLLLTATFLLAIMTSLPRPLSASSTTAPSDSDETLVDFRTEITHFSLHELRQSKQDADGLSLLIPAHSESPSIVISPTNNRWDLTNWSRVRVELSNQSNKTIRIRSRIENDGATDWSDSVGNDGFIDPLERRSFDVFLYRDFSDLKTHPALKLLEGMNGLPGGWMWHWRNVDASRLRRMSISFSSSDVDVPIVLHRLIATEPVVSRQLLDGRDSFFPFVDRYGQYLHKSWPGKVGNDDDLSASRRAEEEELTARASMPDRDQYGGWENGPQREKSSRFRTEKIDGRWWLVDPGGRLFWSHGVCCVGSGAGATSTAGREKYFAELPSGSTNTVNFLEANLKKQFGDDWKAQADDLAIRRLQSWGMNTIGNWSEPGIEQLHRLPYTREIHLWPPRISENLFDVFDPAWIETSKKVIADLTRDWRDDPWCIGFFVDNELGWEGSGRAFIAKLFAVRESSFTKQEFVKALRSLTSDDIGRLNQLLGTDFKNWDAVLAGKKKLKVEQVAAIGEIADAFFKRYVDAYFDFVGPAIHAAAPGKLYLGCRLNITNDVVTRSAARYCDVLSFNLYRSEVAGFRLPGGIDKPVLVSEFHFGALDRGMFHTGLQPANDQRDRADKYRYYVQSALSNPIIVGTHWFEYASEPLTGRGDGENYNDGLIDVCNQPYTELRDTVREVGAAIYNTARRH